MPEIWFMASADGVVRPPAVSEPSTDEVLGGRNAA